MHVPHPSHAQTIYSCSSLVKPAGQGKTRAHCLERVVEQASATAAGPRLVWARVRKTKIRRCTRLPKGQQLRRHDDQLRQRRRKFVHAGLKERDGHRRLAQALRGSDKGSRGSKRGLNRSINSSRKATWRKPSPCRPGPAARRGQRGTTHKQKRFTLRLLGNRSNAPGRPQAWRRAPAPPPGAAS